MTTVDELFARAARVDATRPFMTFYDDATGERTELSYTTMDNWISKTANLLEDGAGVEEGDLAELALPPHWLGAAIMLGCWRAGVAMVHGQTPAHDLATRPTPHVLFADEAADRPDAQPLNASYAVSTVPLAVGVRDATARQRVSDGDAEDFLVEVRGHGDHYAGMPPGDETPALAWLPGGGQLSHDRLVAAARDRVAELGIGESERIMFAADRIAPLDWVLVPLAAKGSVVLSRNTAADAAERAATERARPL